MATGRATAGSSRCGAAARPLDQRPQPRRRRPDPANLAIPQIGDDGNIRLYTQTGTHLVVDLTGVFRPAASANAGRLVPLGPTRLVDTRRPRIRAAGETRTIDATVVGVPADADAVVVSFTGIGPAGWFAAWPAGRPWPGTSVVNTEAATAGDGVGDRAAHVRPVRSRRCVAATSSSTSTATSRDRMRRRAPRGCSCPSRRCVSDTRGDNGSMPPIGPAATLQTAAFPFDVASAGSVALDVTTVEPSSDGFLTAPDRHRPAQRVDRQHAQPSGARRRRSRRCRRPG
ncbi:MAG: hypothetical protein R2713_13760 [Ilumatobacteraceae bacterium]